MYDGQQEMNDDAIALAWEKSNCLRNELRTDREAVCNDRTATLGSAQASIRQ